jgi:hypothetical protein
LFEVGKAGDEEDSFGFVFGELAHAFRNFS